MIHMELPTPDTRASLRWVIYSLLIVAAAGTLVGRILAVRSDRGATPFLSANDRSRWCTISAIVDHGTYAIDEVMVRKVPVEDKLVPREWQTIDKVQHQDAHGNWRFYSSKPPLLPTLLAGEYWMIKKLTGAPIAEQPFYVGRLMLILTNIVPLVIAFGVLALMVERFGSSDFGRVFIMAAATFGTLMTSFAVTLNNHVPAAVSVTIAIYALLRVWYDSDRQWWLFVLAGVFGAFAAANELPALAFLACLGLGLILKSPLRTLALFVPAVAVVAVPFFWINYAVHGSLRLPYAHWRDGEEVVALDHDVSGRLDEGHFPAKLQEKMLEAGITLPKKVLVIDQLKDPRAGVRWIDEANDPAKKQLIVVERTPNKNRGESGRWVLDLAGKERYSLVESDGVTRLHRWDNWYDFPGSYWAGGQQTGVDAGEPSRLVYLFHMVLGHHGLLSLTPIWGLSLIGVVVLAISRHRELHVFGWMVAAISLVVIAFYVSRPELQRNYGGVTCGLRWLLWLSPLWLVAMIPAVDWIGGGERDRRVWWSLALFLLLLSAVTSAYAALDPWTHPWIYQYFEYLGVPLSTRDVLLPR
jgi:hypothetical protein